MCPALKCVPIGNQLGCGLRTLGMLEAGAIPVVSLFSGVLGLELGLSELMPQVKGEADC